MNDCCDAHGALLPDETAQLDPDADCCVVDLDAPSVEIDTDDPLQRAD